MEVPIFKTQNPSSPSKVSIFADRLEYGNKFEVVNRQMSIPLEQIVQTAFVPKAPGTDPRLIDLAVKIQGQPTLVVKDLGVDEAHEIRETLRSIRISRPQKVREKHPFTVAQRVVQGSASKRKEEEKEKLPLNRFGSPPKI